MKIEDLNVQLSVSITADRALIVNKKADELKTSKRCVIEEMIDYCTKNDVLKGKKKPRRQRASRIDHYATVSAAWERSARRKDGTGRQLVTAEDVKNHLVTLGKTEATAAQYCSKKIPQNPLFVGMSEGWLSQDGALYVITPRRYTDADEIAERDPEGYDRAFGKIGNASKMSDEEINPAIVAAYYEEAEK